MLFALQLKLYLNDRYDWSKTIVMYVLLYFGKTWAEVTLCCIPGIQFAMLLLVTWHFFSTFSATTNKNE